MKAVRNWIKRNFAGLLYGRKADPSKKAELLEWLHRFENKKIKRLSDLSYNIFTYHGEDGILAWLSRALKDMTPVFVDIGAGNCITGNTSMLAIHFGWKGIFIDKDEKQIETGKKFFSRTKRGVAGLNFIAADADPAGINSVIGHTGIEGEIGLLSIDIDGNDYWVWKAISVIQPRIVVVEAKVEFGQQDLVVPFGKKNNRSVDIKYNGASVEAFRKLGIQKGYKLIGANEHGYNLFFVKRSEELPAVSTADVLWNQKTINSFYPPAFFKGRKFVKE